MKWYANFLVGCLVGAVGLAVLGMVAMPKLMLTVQESRYATVDETTAALKSAIEAQGWQCPAIRNMNASMAKEGVVFESPIRIVELCKAEYAKEVLTDSPEVSTMMPCAWGVYQQDGKVWISGMNMGLMGKMFGGTIARVIGGPVAHDEAAILKRVVK